MADTTLSKLEKNLKVAKMDNNIKAIRVITEKIAEIKKSRYNNNNTINIPKKSKIDINTLAAKHVRVLKPVNTPESVSAGDDKIILDYETLFNLCNLREEFFDTVTLFEPLRSPAIKALQTLEKKGIINTNGKVGGCSSCKKKTLVSVLTQLFKHIQTIILHCKKENRLHELGNQIREVISPDKYRTLVIYLGGENGNFERIEF